MREEEGELMTMKYYDYSNIFNAYVCVQKFQRYFQVVMEPINLIIVEQTWSYRVEQVGLERCKCVYV